MGCWFGDAKPQQMVKDRNKKQQREKIMSINQMFDQFSTVPIYNTKAVAQETSVPADTFRAWERRYGIPQPHRTNGGHRLYSEREIAIIRWLRDRTAEGMTISQAIALMNNGNDNTNLSWISSAVDTQPHGWDRLNRQLLAALKDFDEKRAEFVLSDAFALYPLENVLLKLIQPTLIEIGEQWHAGNLNVTTEHFATEFFRRKLFSLFNTYASRDGRGLIITGCAPGELHDIGVLIFSILLVRHGWHVVYLGSNIPMDDMLKTIQDLRPDMVCLSASRQETALELSAIGQAIVATPEPKPMFMYGGQAFQLDDDDGSDFHIPGRLLASDAQDAIEMIAEVMHDTQSSLSFSSKALSDTPSLIEGEMAVGKAG